MTFNHGLNPGDVVDNQQLMNIFKCGQQGGMRRSLSTNSLVIISDPFKSLYEDKWIGDILHYTGMGKKGDQVLDGNQNKTLAKSNSNGVAVYLFEVFKPKQYTFIGRVKLIDEPYQERQPDEDGDIRNVWMFPLKVVSDDFFIIPNDLLEEKNEHFQKEANKLTDEELKKRANFAKKEPGSRKVTTTTYERDPYITEYAKRRANGICQLCENPAPFKDKHGKPYLETHHIDWLSQGGKDSIENTVALCPNCHRKMHILNLEKDKKVLKTKALGQGA